MGTGGKVVRILNTHLLVLAHIKARNIYYRADCQCHFFLPNGLLKVTSDNLSVNN
jgi:hypothetical protein